VEAKKIRLIEEMKEPELTIVRQIQTEVERLIKESPSLKEKADSITVTPLLWQSYVWLDYELCEEALIICGIHQKDGNAYTLLVKASRSPYTRGHNMWRIEWRPSEAYDGSKQFQWEFVEMASMRPPGKILRWSYEREFFDRVKEIGTPLLQRWIFVNSWKKNLDRSITKEELTILQSSAIPKME
jgi:hypothetical protein